MAAHYLLFPHPCIQISLNPAIFATLEPNPCEGPKATATDAGAVMIPQGYNWSTALFALATTMDRGVSYVGVAACPRILCSAYGYPIFCDTFRSLSVRGYLYGRFQDNTTVTGTLRSNQSILTLYEGKKYTISYWPCNECGERYSICSVSRERR